MFTRDMEISVAVRKMSYRITWGFQSHDSPVKTTSRRKEGCRAGVREDCKEISKNIFRFIMGTTWVTGHKLFTMYAGVIDTKIGISQRFTGGRKKI